MIIAPLLRRQRACLAQQFGRDADLADVVEEGAVAQAVELVAGDADAGADADGDVGDLVGMVGGVGVLQLDGVGEDGDRGQEGVLEFADQLAAMDRLADLAGNDVGEQQVLLGEGAGLALLEIHHAPGRSGDGDRDGELGAGVRAGAADVVGVLAGVVDERRAAGAGDPAVDADLDRLLGDEEVGDVFGQRAGAVDDAQHAVGVEPLDDGEVVVEGLVQVADRLAGDLLDRQPVGERAGQPAGGKQARGLGAAVGGRSGDWHRARLRLHVHLISTADRACL
jgi:hypothetical protein